MEDEIIVADQTVNPMIKKTWGVIRNSLYIGFDHTY